MPSNWVPITYGGPRSLSHDRDFSQFTRWGADTEQGVRICIAHPVMATPIGTIENG